MTSLPFLRRVLCALAVGTIVASASTPVAAAGAVSDTSAEWVLPSVRFTPAPAAPAGFNVEGVGAYPGTIEINGSGSLNVINEVTLDQYIEGISEVPSSWPAEALKAQATAARTYVLHELRRGGPPQAKAVGADICATDACQVYNGLAKARAPGGANWVAAVRATSNQVLLYNGAPLLAKYSSSNGGLSVAGGQPYLKAIADRDDAASPLHSWTVTFDRVRAQSLFGLASAPTAVRMDGTNVVFTSTGANGAPVDKAIGITDFRARVNSGVPPAGRPITVPSARFTVALSGSNVVMNGRGYGHGIGMSQYGALGKANRGMRHADILAAYYGGIRPTTYAGPASVRVAVATGRPTVSVKPEGAFIVSGPAGPLLDSFEGTWTVSPAGNGVKVRVTGLTPLALESSIGASVVRPSEGAVIRGTTSTAAHVRATIDGTSLVVEADVKGAFELVLPAAAPGKHSVTLTATAGGNRTATAPLEFKVAEPPTISIPTGPLVAMPSVYKLPKLTKKASAVAPVKSNSGLSPEGPVERGAVVLVGGLAWLAASKAAGLRRRLLRR